MDDQLYYINVSTKSFRGGKCETTNDTSHVRGLDNVKIYIICMIGNGDFEELWRMKMGMDTEKLDEVQYWVENELKIKNVEVKVGEVQVVDAQKELYFDGFDGDDKCDVYWHNELYHLASGFKDLCEVLRELINENMDEFGENAEYLLGNLKLCTTNIYLEGWMNWYSNDIPDHFRLEYHWE